MQRPDHATQQPKIFLENLLLTLKHFTSLCSALKDLNTDIKFEVFDVPDPTEKRDWALPDALDNASKIVQTLWVLQVMSNEAFDAVDDCPVLKDLKCSGGDAIDLMCEVAEGTERYMAEGSVEEWEDDRPSGWIYAIEDILDSLEEVKSKSTQ